MRYGRGVPTIIGCILLAACVDADKAPVAVERAAAVAADDEEGGDPEPLPFLTGTQLAAFQAGQAVFSRVFDESTGLGPIFNADACSECHEDPVVGGAGDEVEVHFSFEAGAPAPCDMLPAAGGNVLQQHTTQLLFNATGYVSEPETSSPHGLGRRTAPDLLGFGLIDAISDAEILSRADPNDANHDGISGRAHITPIGVGRFGRKASERSLDAFNAGAFLQEMGVTNPVNPAENSIGGAPIPAGVDPAADPELNASDLQLANTFVRFLAMPKQETFTQQATAGKNLFVSVGCAACHTPTIKTGSNPVRALDKVTVKLFSDLLLHDIGTGSTADDVCQGDAPSNEFRTEPLMGLRFNPAFLHDGRAATIEQAIGFHGNEAAGSRSRFNALNSGQQAALLAYLNSI